MERPQGEKIDLQIILLLQPLRNDNNITDKVQGQEIQYPLVFRIRTRYIANHKYQCLGLQAV